MYLVGNNIIFVSVHRRKTHSPNKRNSSCPKINESLYGTVKYNANCAAHSVECMCNIHLLIKWKQKTTDTQSNLRWMAHRTAPASAATGQKGRLCVRAPCNVSVRRSDDDDELNYLQMLLETDGQRHFRVSFTPALFGKERCVTHYLCLWICTDHTRIALGIHKIAKIFSLCWVVDLYGFRIKILFSDHTQSWLSLNCMWWVRIYVLPDARKTLPLVLLLYFQNTILIYLQRDETTE